MSTEKRRFSGYPPRTSGGANGGALSFDVPLSGEGGTLILEARFGPPGVEANGFADWSYWRDIAFR